MQRLLVALLAAVDAAIAAAVGLVVLLAPLTLLWIVAFGVAGDWAALWPTTATLWQFGHGAALSVTIPDDMVVAVGIDPDAAEFVLSLVPLAFLCFTLLFAGRSGVRAIRAGAGAVGVAAGTVTFAAIAAGVALTGSLGAVETSLGQAIVFPPLVYLVGALAGALGAAWRLGDEGPVSQLRAWVEDYHEWGAVPESIVRGGLAAIVGMVGFGGVLVAVAVFAGMGEIVALFEALGVDALGATVITLGQLAYVPVLVIWAIAWLAGPGFAVGTGTAISPAGTELSVIPAIPVLGALPENTSMWALVVVLVPVAVGAFAGWMIRSRLVSHGGDIGLFPRAAIAVGIAALAAGFGRRPRGWPPARSDPVAWPSSARIRGSWRSPSARRCSSAARSSCSRRATVKRSPRSAPGRRLSPGWGSPLRALSRPTRPSSRPPRSLSRAHTPPRLRATRSIGRREAGDRRIRGLGCRHRPEGETVPMDLGFLGDDSEEGIGDGDPSSPR
ncbi:DUF6350 family protein [Microbacterium sp. NIBRBAC000506063]|uniref:cell division protein PerM n=1 Tax=Microbacterium sp. NIBRBAC000506063 TaxID=2734618 RepID=UPI001BB719AA|nr:DUF6350 family protein [Microbacterium sp. NIBRBAC000506063]QTV79318.1 hypothetical protein KAE78_09930 [Microbacterium sp. NIBRBAC000506063]